ncbi:MAG: hypothetical protein RR313_03635 [Anaerovoracaceae bacterium]
MALTKPAMYQQVAFDASNAQIFKFDVVGGDQVVSNRLIIKNSSTLAVVYNQQQVTYQLQHTVGAGLLINGDYYTAQVQTYNSAGATSDLSTPIQFRCYTTPTLLFTNIPVGNLIEASSFNFEFQYNQIQGERLESYRLVLYDKNKIEISSSGVQYVDSTSPLPLTFQYRFAGFDDDGRYYVKADGVTIYGTSITSGYVQFSVNYINPAIFAQLELTNDACNGWIQVRSNMVSLAGESNPSPPVYIGNKRVDLTASGSWVRWSAGYTINGDFTLGVWIENATIDANVLELSNSNTNENIKLYYRNGKDYLSTVNKAFYECVVTQGVNQPYYIYSNYIPIPANNEQVFIWLRRVNNIYQLKIENRGVIV